MPNDFASFRDLQTALVTAEKDGKNLLDILPDIMVKGVPLSPIAVYVDGDNFVGSPEDLAKARSISLVYSAPPIGDVRIQVNKDNSGYVSGYIGGQGVRGGSVHIKDGVINTFQKAIEGSPALLKAMQISSLDNLPKLEGVALAESSAPATAPGNGKPRQLG